MILHVLKYISQSCIGTNFVLGKPELGCTLGWRSKECSLVNTSSIRAFQTGGRVPRAEPHSTGSPGYNSIELVE